jgi:hypothetical protein
MTTHTHTPSLCLNLLSKMFCHSESVPPMSNISIWVTDSYEHISFLFNVIMVVESLMMQAPKSVSKLCMAVIDYVAHRKSFRHFE